MDSLFIYDKMVSGNSFLSRRNDVSRIVKLLKDRQNITIYTAAKTGKQSLVNEALNDLRKSFHDFILLQIDLFNVRSREQLSQALCSKMQVLLKKCNKDSLMLLDIDFDKMSLQELLEFPEKASRSFKKHIIIYFKEFQNILFCDDGEDLLNEIEKVLMPQKNANYIITGSFVNAMKYIFEDKKYFFNFAVNLIPNPISRNDAIDFLYTAFMRTGREILSEQAGMLYDICGGNPWYLMHIGSICYSLTVGYVNNNVIQSAKESLISIHCPRFMHIMGDLTCNQINLLQAVIDGVERFSSSDVMTKYKLNTSANVFRIKEALKKKEVLTFDAEDNASIIDPLFEYWLRNYYFVKI